MSLAGSDREVSFAVEVLERWLVAYDRAEEIYDSLPPEAKARVDAQPGDVEDLAAMIAMRAPEIRWLTHQALKMALEMLRPSPIS